MAFVDKEFEERKMALWEELEKKYGFLLALDVRNFLEEDEVGRLEDYIDGDPEGRDEYLDSLRRVTTRFLKGVKIIQPYLGVAPVLLPSDACQETAKPKKTYRKCFDRRFHLFSFVTDSNLKTGVAEIKRIGLRQYMDKHMNTAKPSRIDWKQTAAEWNEISPSDTMTPSALKAEYYHARKENLLMAQWGLMTIMKTLDSYKEMFLEAERDQVNAGLLDKPYEMTVEWLLNNLNDFFPYESRMPLVSKRRFCRYIIDTLKSVEEIRAKLVKTRLLVAN